jgi:hypothetical protein
MRIVLITLLAACSSYEVHLVDSGTNAMRTCLGSAFDPCTTSDQCDSMNCHLYSGTGVQVCTQVCTPGDNTTCPVDATGANATCNGMGICKPSKANDCVP